MSWRRIVPNLLTLAAMVAAVMSIIKSAHGEYMQAAQWMMLCLILDGLDGSVARLFKGTTKFGAELDTFVDITAYGVAPAMLAYEAVLKHFGAWGLAYTCLTVLSGALRLARFRVADPFRGQRGYLGLPITVNGGWVALFVVVTESGLLNDGRITLSSGPLAALVWTCSLAFLGLQVSNVRYGKPTKAPIFFLCGILFVLMLFMKVEIAVASALAMSAYGFFYAFISPFLPRHDHLLGDEGDEEPVTVRHS
jgi:CDP-diacylglycerol--serine O-phosphatidyltransferase